MHKLSIWCGMLIGIGALAYLTVGGILGAILFAFGLMAVICTGKRNLYTGWIGICNFRAIEGWSRLFSMLLLNSIGVAFVAGLVYCTDINLLDRTNEIVNIRLNSTHLSLFCKSILTGIIMHVCVCCAIHKNTFIPTLIGVPLFILCGLPHCIADVFYYTYYVINNGHIEHILPVLVSWTVSIVGNTVGCNIPRLIDTDIY